MVSSASSQSAVRKTEWQPIGRKYLEGRNIIFHTDSARSYKTRLNKVVHDNVVRCKKKVRVNGKWTWQMPKYVKVTTHTLPGTNKKVKAKAGTQIVDRAWRYIKDRLSLNQSTRPGSRLIRASTDPGSSVSVLAQERGCMESRLQAQPLRHAEDHGRVTAARTKQLLRMQLRSNSYVSIGAGKRPCVRSCARCERQLHGKVLTILLCVSQGYIAYHGGFWAGGVAYIYIYIFVSFGKGRWGGGGGGGAILLLRRSAKF